MDSIRLTSKKGYKISAVIPAFNRQDTIVRCLNSIISQTYPLFEIIIVDDGSTDATVSAIERFISEHREHDIKLINGQHKGAQAARNAGVFASTGDWIAFLDSDDEWLPTRIERVVEELDNNGNKNVIIANTCYRNDGRGLVKWDLPGKSGDIYADLLLHPWPMFQGMIIPRESILQIGYLDEKCPCYQEWDTSIRLAKINQFVYLDEPLFVYYVNQTIDTISSSGKDYLGYIYIFNKYRTEIKNVCGRAGIRRHYGELAGKCRGIKSIWYRIMKEF